MNNFPDLKQATAQFGGGSEFYKFEKGDNRIRILAIAEEPIAKHFVKNKPVTCVGINHGCPLHGEGAPKDDSGKPRSPSIKYMAYIIDRDLPEQIRLADIPFSVMKQLADLKNNPDWSFEALPMTYDVTVKYDPDAAGTEMYKLIPSPKSAPVTPDVAEKLSKLKPLAEIVQHVREKATAEMDLPPVESHAPASEELPVIDLDEEEEPKDEVPF